MVKKKRKKSGSKGMVIGVVLVVIVIVVVIGIFAFSGGEKYVQADVDAFATCLTESGAVMYGTFWCPHCAATKKKFGSSFQFISYVECDPRGDNEQAELCIEKGIDRYDTWEFNGDAGSRVIGEPTFEQLAEKTGCPVPEEK